MKTIAIAAAAIALLTTPALANDEMGAREAISVRVSTSGLDLNTARGQERLRTRVKWAIERACNPAGRFSLDNSTDAQCHQEMITSASASPLMRNLAQNQTANPVAQN